MKKGREVEKQSPSSALLKKSPKQGTGIGKVKKHQAERRVTMVTEYL